MPHRSKSSARRSAEARRQLTLGRIFSVTRETWRLSDDPQATDPEVEIVASRRTASDAADIAREAALAYRRHGFDKPSRSWWGAEEGSFHRFRVEGPKPRTALAIAVVSGVAGLAVLALVGKSRKPKRG